MTKLIVDLELMIASIGSNAVKENMQFYDADAEKLYEGEDEDAAAARRGRMKEEAEARRAKEAELEKQRREAMIKNWSDLDRQKLQEAHDGLNKRQDALKKELTEQMNAKKENLQEELTFAIYDDGNIKSRMNQVVAKIEKNEDLNEAEREALL